MKFIRRLPWAALSHYAFTILVVAITTGLLKLFQANLSIQVIALIYLLPVVLSARLWGLGPGILAALLAFLNFNYFFLPPYLSFTVAHPQDLLALIVFLVIAVVVSQLLGQDQQSLAATTAREREATLLYELSTALTGLLDEQAIAQIVASKVCETFYAQKVEVIVNDVPEGTSQDCQEGAPPLPVRPDQAFALASARGQLGRVHIWRRDQPFSESERKLLTTFLGQGALALERSRLIQSENRTRVLEESDRLKSALLSSVSHELRTPLATIKAAISSLRSEAIELDTEAESDLLAAIEEETDQLNQLVGNILDMSRIETGSLNPQRKWNSLAEIARGVVKKMGQGVQRHRVTIDIPPDFPLVPVDYVLMAQVFSNLVSNSVKYAPPGSEIIVRARQEGQTARVQVINQGPPVAEENLDRIFDKFYRVTAADKITGTGLGLSICKGIVEAHGGRIWAENGPGCFIFNFTLPLDWEGALPHVPEEE